MIVEIYLDIDRLNPDGETVREIRVLVAGEYSPPCKGSRDTYGQAIEPDYPASIEILSATDETGEEIELDKYELQTALSLLWQEIGGD